MDGRAAHTSQEIGNLGQIWGNLGQILPWGTWETSWKQNLKNLNFLNLNFKFEKLKIARRRATLQLGMPWNNLETKFEKFKFLNFWPRFWTRFCGFEKLKIVSSTAATLLRGGVRENVWV